ncbi:unnamed protein product [Rangifer tarandus platyrhynchus]|uniref:Uncharacterized protein n=1 Tax=Rangifer tarandus platyrhynchus TaxID=3082113 RepID=A0AC60A7X8_RANTA
MERAKDERKEGGQAAPVLQLALQDTLSRAAAPRPAQRQPRATLARSHPCSARGLQARSAPPSPALSPGSSCAWSGPGSAPAPQRPRSPITLMSAPLPLGFIGSQPAPPG